MTALSTQGPHPLADRLIARYREAALRGPVLEVCSGSGRSTRALEAAGLTVVATSDDDPYTQLPGSRDSYAAALSTHGYLHGRTDKVRAGFGELRRVLRAGAPIFVTLGSIKDARFGFGQEVDERTFAAGDGPEKGIPHAFFERAGIPDVMRGFTIESLEELKVDEVVGRWAHGPREQGLYHWFVVAVKNRS
jgi:hypothetical protein